MQTDRQTERQTDTPPPHTHTHARTHARIHTHAHTHTHTNTQTNLRFWAFRRIIHISTALSFRQETATRLPPSEHRAYTERLSAHGCRGNTLLYLRSLSTQGRSVRLGSRACWARVGSKLFQNANTLRVLSLSGKRQTTTAKSGKRKWCCCPGRDKSPTMEEGCSKWHH